MDLAGDILTLTDANRYVLTKDTYMTGMYVIEATGAQTKHFYISHGDLFGELVNLRYLVDDAVTLSIELQSIALKAANWQPSPAHSTGVMAAADAQKLNTNYPKREIITTGSSMRVEATVSGACNIGVQAVGILGCAPAREVIT
ncbi:MAG: hypothetical protein JRI70_07480 [Deltaproteobacteria bacterium]|nr:hypothetical protein [Deltaproteobacteria bacterium]